MRTETGLTLGLALILMWSACAPENEIGGAYPSSSTETEVASGTTYFVRTDGGSPSQCNGRADAPYDGSSEDCAWDHPFRALPPGGAPRITGGDTLIVASGSYMMGYGAPGADDCETDYPWDCHVPAIPSGPEAANPTRILGKGWDSGCPQPPELWGTERANYVLNLIDASNIEIACLEITDHSACVEDHSGGLACERESYPYGAWAPVGIYAEDAANVHLHDLNVHGLATNGIWAGRLSDWTVERVRIAANGWAGWDGDIEGQDSNSGTLLFRNWTVEWNGCGETYPGGSPAGCWAQTAGGYGDGVGTGASGGSWIIEDSAFLHNTSDGLDLLYHSLGGSIVLNRVRAEGNAGNQIKVTGQTAITNSVLVGNCTFFEGQAFTYDVDPCRALGNTLEFAYTGGEQSSIVNTTFYGQGDGLVGAGPRENYACDGSETLTGRNNVFLGDTDFFDPGDVTFLFYQEGCGALTFEGDHSIAFNVKNVEAPWVDPPFPSAHNLLQNPQLTGPFSGTVYGMMPSFGSPAIDAADNAACPSSDIIGVTRPADGDRDGNAICDMGAYEVPHVTAWVHLPTTLKDTTLSQTQEPPQLAGCDVFPANNIWNTPVDSLPLDSNTDDYVSTIGADRSVHADFGAGEWPPSSGAPIGIPFVTVPDTQRLISVSFDYAKESDSGPYPIPADAPIEGGPDAEGDRHVLILDRDNCLLYEMFDAWPQDGGSSWQAGSGAIFDLTSNHLRRQGWTSADAAGLPILAGLVRYEEVAAGEIRHALRFTAPQTRREYIWPARHFASNLTGEAYPPMGQRFRLKADFDTAGFGPQVQVILQALKRYGMILADNGSAWFISGVPDERWDNNELHELHQVQGKDFEAVDVSALMVDPDSAQAQRP